MTEFEKIMIKSQMLNAKLALVQARQSNLAFLAHSAELAAIRRLAENAGVSSEFIDAIKATENHLIKQSPGVSHSLESIMKDLEGLAALIQAFSDDSDGSFDLTNFKFSPN